MNEQMLETERAKEQVETAMDSLAVIVASYYHSLREQQVPDHMADMLTAQFAEIWLHKQIFNAPPNVSEV